MMYQYPDYLMHYGVRGMKWGQRRRQRIIGRSKKQMSKRLNKSESKMKKLFNGEKTLKLEGPSLIQIEIMR